MKTQLSLGMKLVYAITPALFMYRATVGGVTEIVFGLAIPFALYWQARRVALRGRSKATESFLDMLFAFWGILLVMFRYGGDYNIYSAVSNVCCIVARFAGGHEELQNDKILNGLQIEKRQTDGDEGSEEFVFQWMQRRFTFTVEANEWRNLDYGDSFEDRVKSGVGNVQQSLSFRLRAVYRDRDSHLSLAVIQGDNDMAYHDHHAGMDEWAILWVGSMVRLWYKLPYRAYAHWYP